MLTLIVDKSIGSKGNPGLVSISRDERGEGRCRTCLKRDIERICCLHLGGSGRVAV